ncbi:flagellar basal-body MS-ring/collar protein FliF [Shewanella morhuae]|uniref:Flagellar M-ring protein n=1 Tax=Shewanella morhuae TaxID=365591 RepID=A0A1N6X4Q7_9GAMM|nr:flagellar basal-body MS-ring/collar protein FliF [Shewanella morhuae]SIQ97231.1 flagellar M-ring protein FliF [Shewanella morhuae]SUI91567.1 Flagellar M-ring protein [Shewanella morhuae]
MSTTFVQSGQGIRTESSSGFMAGMTQKWHQFTRGDRQVIALALLAVIVASVIVLMLWTSTAGYRPLYGNQENVDTSQVLAVLDAEGINYRLDANSGAVLVAEEQVGSARMLLAAKGVKAKVPSGMEDLENTALGTSQFMEQAKYRHSLEGELARTIMSLKSVRAARVHLAIPKKSLFIRQEPELPTASVMLQLDPNTSLTESQVEAIVNLVAGSVTGLSVGNIKVVDQDGHYLSENISGNQDLSQSRNKQLQYTRELEHNLVTNASSMLEPVLGQENFQVRVTAKVNFNQVEETKESLDPQSVVTQERTSVDDSSNSIAAGIPGALSNKPPQAGPAAADDKTRNLKQEESRQYDVGRSVRHVRYQQMQLENLSVSVLINSAAGQGGFNDEAQLVKFGNMVKDAIGFSAARGDSFTINAFEFTPTVIPEITPSPWWQAEHYQSYLRYLIGGILGIGLILFVLRPLVKHLTRTAQVMAPRIEPVALSPNAIGAVEGPVHAATETQQLPNADWLGSQGLPEPGSPLTVKMEHLAMLANKEPARVAEVIAHWIGDKDGE